MNSIRLKMYGSVVLLVAVAVVILVMIINRLPASIGIEQIDANTARISQGDVLVLKNGKSYYEFTFDGDQTVVVDRNVIFSSPEQYILCGVDCELEIRAGQLFQGRPTLTLRADNQVDIHWPSGRWWLR